MSHTHIQFRVDAEYKAMVKAAARADKLTITEYMRRLIDADLNDLNNQARRGK